MKRLIRRWGLLGVLLLAGCALSPNQPQGIARSEALLDEQLQRVRAVVAATPADERVLVYLGFAMNSRSKAFQGDALLGQKVFGALNANTSSVILSNLPQTLNLAYPFATADTAKRALTEVGRIVKGRKAAVVVLISTHGVADVLTINIADTDYPPIRPIELATWLAELGETPTVVILSACYSGSFINALKSPTRVVLAAAAANRSSFGCQSDSRNTYFVETLLGPDFSGQLTLQQWFARTRKSIDAKEKILGLAPPSNPQASPFAGAASWMTLQDLLGK
jgi:hypothetical protein